MFQRGDGRWTEEPDRDRRPTWRVSGKRSTSSRSAPTVLCLCLLTLGLVSSGPAALAQESDEPRDLGTLVSLLELVLEANEQSARQCLAVLSDKIQSGELTGRRLESLRPRLKTLTDKILDQGRGHPLFADSVTLSASMGDKRGADEALATLRSRTEGSQQRVAALSALVSVGDLRVLAAAAENLEGKSDDDEQLDGATRRELRSGVIGELGDLDHDGVAELLLDRYTVIDAELRPRVVEVITQRTSWSKLLVSRIGQGTIPTDSLNANQVRKLMATRDQELTRLVQRHWGAVRLKRDPRREQVIDGMRKLIATTPGDPSRGERVFHRVCGQCHTIHGKGESVGPDITSNGRGSFEQLLSNVFDPSLVIGASYQARTVITEKGRVLTGLLVEDSDLRVVLKVQGGKQEVVARDDVDELTVSELSLMPEGLEKQLQPGEIADLFSFLLLDRPPGDPDAHRIPGSPAVVEPAPTSLHWPQWRGPLGTGEAPGADPPLEWSETKNVRWKVPLPGLGHSTPVIWDDRIYLTTAVPFGEPVEPKPDTAPGAHDNSPVTHHHRFVVLCVSREDGQVIWERTVHRCLPHEGGHYSGSLVSNSPVTDGDHVYADFGSRGLYCLDREGQVVWSKSHGLMSTKHAHGEGSSPVLHGDTLVVNWDHEGQSFLVAYDKSDGEPRWKVARDEVTSWATPIVVEHEGARQVVVSGTSRVRAYDLDTGRVVWECGGLSHNIVASPVAGMGMVFAASSYEKQAMLAIRLTGAQGDITGTDHVAWTRVRGTPYVPSPLLYDGSLYFLRHYQGILSRVDARTGEEPSGPFRLGAIRNVYASPVAAAGRVYVTDLDGMTMVIEHGPQPNVLAENRLNDRFAASAALSGRELFLRGARFLYCIGEE